MAKRSPDVDTVVALTAWLVPRQRPVNAPLAVSPQGEVAPAGGDRPVAAGKKRCPRHTAHMAGNRDHLHIRGCLVRCACGNGGEGGEGGEQATYRSAAAVAFRTRDSDDRDSATTLVLGPGGEPTPFTAQAFDPVAAGAASPGRFAWRH